MTQQPPPPEGTADKGAEEDRESVSHAQSPMDNFRDLARAVLNVSRNQVRLEEERFAIANARKRESPTK